MKLTHNINDFSNNLLLVENVFDWSGLFLCYIFIKSRGESSFLNLRFIFHSVRNNSVSLNIYYFKFGGAKHSSEKVELD